MSILRRVFTAKSARNFLRTRRGKTIFTLAFLCSLCACFAVSAVSVFAGFPGQDDGVKYLKNVTEKFLKINDYMVDVRVHLDMESVKAPDMTAKIYYKSPDKVKVDSKGTFLLPKEVGVFNPRMFNSEEYNINILDTLRYDGDPAVRLSLSPKKESFRGRNIILTIDKKDWLIKSIAIEPAAGSLMDARIKYGNFGGFELPAEIDVNLNLPKADSTQENPMANRRFKGGMSGSVVIYYSNYQVNTGLSDSLFEKSEGASPKAGR
jgi:outer membrane lipoprotein-sorting protein